MSDIKDRGTHRSEAADEEKHFARLERQQDNTVEDKDRTAALAKRLKVRGTREGSEAMGVAVEKAGSDLDDLGDAQARSHERAARRARTAEGGLREQATADREDERAARDAVASLRDADARRQIERAARAAEEDSGFLDDLKKEREKVRSRSETGTKDRIRRVKAAKVEVKTKGGGS